MDDFERELKQGFLEEATQILGEAEQCFLGLERAAADPAAAPDLFGQLFRLAHNIKGSAAAVGFEDVKHFTHDFESLILKVKKGELALSPPIINLLLECNDQLTAMINGLKSNLETKFDNTELLKKIQTAMAGESQQPQPQPQPPSQTETRTAAEAVAPSEKSGNAPAAVAAESIRVGLDKLDKLVNNVGEMVIAQGYLNQLRETLEGATPLERRMAELVLGMEKITREIQNLSMSLRMVPLRPTFQKMQRIVRDTSKALGKEVIFYTSGDDTEIDKTVLERISDPLVHLIRNAVDHGLDSSEERKAAGKVPVGTVHLSAHHQGGHIVLEVRDDGRGMDPAKLTAKAIEKGILPAGVKLSDADAYQLIFAPGFSTKAEVSDISGRGVGMDVVKSNIKALQGTIEIETRVGQGSCFRVRLPLTLAIVDGMIVKIGPDRYVVPLANVSESVRPRREDLSPGANGVESLQLRGEQLPVFRLGDLLGRPTLARNPTEGIALVVRDLKERPFSLLVDDIVGSQQVVIKPLGDDIHGLPGIAGGAVLGDGRAALILDINQIMEAAA